MLMKKTIGPNPVLRPRTSNLPSSQAKHYLTRALLSINFNLKCCSLKGEICFTVTTFNKQPTFLNL